MKINKNYLKLKKNYLFTTITQKVQDFKASNPQREVISLGIGDVTLPLAPVVVDALRHAVDEMGHASTFRGYGDEQGYPFLRRAVCGYYAGKGVTLDDSEIFISDGANSDLGNILDLFADDNTVLIPDPVYPVYVDANIMAGREIIYMDGNAGNGFLPLPDKKADIIYLCSPNNPTGATYSRAQLKMWVDFAMENDALILFDSAYEAFVQDDALPTSIYQIENAKECAIEISSFSKMAGFTGTRCGYTVVPNALVRDGAALNPLWYRRQTTKFNGAPYIIQRGAGAVFTPEGFSQVKANIAYYMKNAKFISDTLHGLGIWHTGGENAPYVWLKCPKGMGSWDFFDVLLGEANVVGAPGVGFGAKGEGFFRLSAFAEHEKVSKAMEKVKKFL
ncbi:MAG: LL-diaminopimelate aminotransferase [Defluviitaleaceae bacterium]|nr:LL-diaminopimelate aminotransferase [Defluviitaleaceae bacterium]MCL2239306.1 LL-diaminopimelate aminotransferase [Defluviitaleaceae bacterium]